ncbi:hypothetical protein [Methylorubrum extorquens]
MIELGILKFEYGASGRIYRVLDTLNQLHQPKKPIPPEITRLTGTATLTESVLPLAAPFTALRPNPTAASSIISTRRCDRNRAAHG